MNIYAIIASMKKFLLLIIFVFLTINFANDIAHGALVSTRSYRIEQNKINKNEIKQPIETEERTINTINNLINKKLTN